MSEEKSEESSESSIIDMESAQKKRTRAIHNLEKAIDMIMGHLDAPDLPDEDIVHWSKILGDLSGVLNNILKEMDIPEATKTDVASYLAKVAKLHQQESDERDLGVVATEALYSALDFSKTVLESDDYAIAVKLEWAQVLPDLIATLIALAGIVKSSEPTAFINQSELS
jgi:hypothetical protein